MSLSLRRQRDRDRIRRAGEIAKAHGGSALDVACAKIDAAFDHTAAINTFKIRVELLLQADRHHPALRTRFGARAEMLAGRSLDASVIAVERWWRDEQKAFAIASAFGGGTRLSLDVLRDLRLILRWMRFKRMELEFSQTVVELSRRHIDIAAE
jgi:hypothetical protein